MTKSFKEFTNEAKPSYKVDTRAAQAVADKLSDKLGELMIEYYDLPDDGNTDDPAFSKYRSQMNKEVIKRLAADNK